MEKYSKEQVRAIINELNQNFDATIQSNQAGAPNEIQTLSVDLSTVRERGNALKVSFPFTSVFVEDATDLNTYLRIVPHSNDSIQQDVRLQKGDSYIFDRGVREAYLYWPAQAAKTIILKFLVSSKFNRGSLIVDQTSTPASVEVGNARADLDGFSRQVLFKWSYNKGMEYCYDISDPTFNTGTATVTTTASGAAALSNLFKIPSGYYGEVIGCELNVVTAIDKIQTFRLSAELDAVAYTDDNMITTNRIGNITEEPTASQPSAGTYKARILNAYGAGIKGYDRKGIILYAGEIPCVSSRASFTSAATQGEYKGFLLIRLKPIVGV